MKMKRMRMMIFPVRHGEHSAQRQSCRKMKTRTEIYSVMRKETLQTSLGNSHRTGSSKLQPLIICNSRHLDDAELDSGDDQGRGDRVPEDEEQPEMIAQERQVLDVDLPRLPVPEPSDGEVSQ